MRIIHFLHPEGGDHLAHVFDLAQRQDMAGHEVGIVFGDDGRVSTGRERVEKAGTYCQSGILRLELKPSLSSADLAALRSSIDFCREKKPDIIHGHGARAGALARLAASRLGGKSAGRPVCLYSPHNAGMVKSHGPWASARLEKYLGRRSDGIVFESEFCRENYISRHGPPPCDSRIIADGLPEEAFAPRRIINDAHDFLFIGNLDRRAGVDVLIAALGRMKSKRPAGALIVGHGPQEEELRRQASRYGLSHLVFFSPPIKSSLAFIKASCLVLPSRTPSVPLIMLQAAAAGLPMILSGSGGLEEFLGDVDMPLCPPGNVDILQKHLEEFLDSPKPFLNRAAALKERVAQKFTIERMADELEEFYEFLLKGKR